MSEYTEKHDYFRGRFRTFASVLMLSHDESFLLILFLVVVVFYICI